MIVSLGKFNLRGRYEGHSCEVVRKGDMLVLTFINNAVVINNLTFFAKEMTAYR